MSRLSDHTTWREGQWIAAVTLVSMLMAFGAAGGLAYVTTGAGMPWWLVTPVAWIAVYFTMRALLRYFITQRMRSM